MNGAVQIAQLIECGAIDAGIVVGTEDSRGLTEATIAQLLGDQTLTRQSIKPAFASLTIGSGSCAWLLAHRDLARNRASVPGAKVQGAVAVANTGFHELCQSDTDQAGAGMQPLMNTDSEQLLEAGLQTGKEAFERMLTELDWARETIDATVCHQVGSAHRRRMLESIGMPVDTDYATFDRFGNTGSVALPTAFGLAVAGQHLVGRKRAALLGIGSGINSVMIGLELDEIASRGA
jgi:3-oxoacyl-[acyl-carrier-protein] synthase-3